MRLMLVNTVVSLPDGHDAAGLRAGGSILREALFLIRQIRIELHLFDIEFASAISAWARLTKTAGAVLNRL